MAADELFAAPLAAFEASLGLPAPPASRKGPRPPRQQQDAQEFLSFLLAAAHAELLLLLPPAPPPPAPEPPSEEEEWATVGRGNVVTTTRTHSELAQPASRASLVTALFGGVQESTVKCRGERPSVTVEPFTLLSLDVSGDAVRSVEEALAAFAAPETIPDYANSRGVVEGAVRTLALRPPPLLLIHLKLFAYTARGLEKLRKRVTFREALALDKPVSLEAARYRLAALVEHVGVSPRRGHYIAYARETASGAWVRYDDANVATVRLEEVLDRPAYILVYEREADSAAK